MICASQSWGQIHPAVPSPGAGGGAPCHLLLLEVCPDVGHTQLDVVDVAGLGGDELLHGQALAQLHPVTGHHLIDGLFILSCILRAGLCARHLSGALQGGQRQPWHCCSGAQPSSVPVLPPLCLGHPTAHPRGRSTHLHLQALSKAMKCCEAGAGWLQAPTCGTCQTHTLVTTCGAGVQARGPPGASSTPGTPQVPPSTGTVQGPVPMGRAGFVTSTAAPCCQLFPPCLGCRRLAPCLAFKGPVQSTKSGSALLEQEMFL